MSIYTLNGKRINIHARFTAEDGTHGIDLTRPENREKYGIEEHPELQAPEDYSDKLYYRTEQDEAPFVVYTRKSDEQIAQANRAEVQAQIDALEREAMLPRVAREFMLIQFQAVAAAQGVDPMENFGYRKVKELDDKINALRASL